MQNNILRINVKNTLQASLVAPNGDVIDTYSQKIGIRTVTWSNKTIYLNEKPLYLRGFGMHEDSDVSLFCYIKRLNISVKNNSCNHRKSLCFLIAFWFLSPKFIQILQLRGKGWDPVLWVKNFNLIKWVGANAFRTSHYPYAEEIYQMADENGIMVIDECPSVDTE